jgi:hypothetical protein
MDERQLERLRAPFPMEAHDWKPGATTKDKKRALGLAYVDSRQYQTRLDEVDPEWSNSYTPLVVDGRIVVNCELTVLGITREDVGECSLRDDNAYTSAVAQAFKRACAQFGLGRYLYDVPQVWAEYDEGRRRFSDSGLKTLKQALAASIHGNGPKAQPGHSALPARSRTTASGNGNGKMSLDEALAVTMPCGTKNHPEYEGKALSEIEAADSRVVDWLADKATSAELREAAATIVAARN